MKKDKSPPKSGPSEKGKGRGRTEKPQVSPGRIKSITRDWIGTPYRHQSAVRGAGCDCLGLLRGVWTELYGNEPEDPPPYSRDWDETERREVLFEAARRHLVERERSEPRPGEVILFRMRKGSVAKHLGIAVSEARFVHSYSGHGVVESALTQPWRRRIAGVFAFPGLD